MSKTIKIDFVETSRESSVKIMIDGDVSVRQLNRAIKLLRQERDSKKNVSVSSTTSGYINYPYTLC